MTAHGRRTRRAFVFLALILASACGDGGTGQRQGEEEPLFSRGTLVIETDGGSVVLDVEIAETRRARATGLMGRESLPEDAGMVFLERQPVRLSFWMKDTLIPLSIAFWGEENEILAILDMEPCRADPCPTHDPGVAWTGAVEVNQGFFTRNGVEVGDEVTLEREG
jgi:uncharacterized membrane protein (UPF0127 family)